MSDPTAARHHHLTPLVGRDPDEQGRVSSPLELLFDLSFAVSFGIAGSNLAALVSEGHLTMGLLGFMLAGIAIIWAWINYSWFASAYENDDLGSRLVAMMIMVGVVITALGLQPMFASLVSGGNFDNRTMLLGYVIMRLSLLVGWLRAWRSDRARRPVINRYIATLVLAQAGWLLTGLLPLPVGPAMACWSLLLLVEMTGPFLAERQAGGTPWHAHHIAERYSLLAIITLGEGVIGTVATLSAAVGEHGWTLGAGQVVVAGIGLTFGLWWVYFTMEPGPILARFRERSFGFGYLHIPMFMAIAATGAGLQVAGRWLAGDTRISEFLALCCVAVPVAVYVMLIFALYYLLLRGAPGGNGVFHTAMAAGTVLMVVIALVMARAGLPLGWCLLVVMLAPAVIVVGYETVGHRHMAADQAALLAED